MSALQKTFRNMTGVALTGASVVITRSADSSVPPVYSLTNDGPGELLDSNAVELDDSGSISVWVPDGLYHLQVMLGSTEVVAFANVQVGNGAVPTTSSYYDRAEAVAAAARGDIPAEANTIQVQSFANGFENSAARFSRISQAALDALGLLPATKTLVAFPDWSGDWWLMDEPRPRLEQLGCFGQPLGQQPITTADYDCSDYILAAADYGVKRWKACVVEYGNANFYLHKNTSMPDMAGLTGPETRGNATLQLPDLESVGGVNWMPGLVINPTASLRIGNNFYSDFLGVKRAGIIIHTDAVGALDSQSSFSGVGVKKTSGGASRNVKIRNFAAYGFAFGMIAENMHGVRFGDVFGDCLTLVMGLDCGETISIDEPAKRKPILSINDSIKDTTVGVIALYDAGGKVGLVTNADVLALGLTTGQRCGNQKLTGSFDNTLRTVTVQDGTHVILEGTTWDSAYASYVLTSKSTITWNPGMSSGVSSFYDAGGKVGVRTIAPLPFNVGHKGLLACGSLAPRGMRNILTKVSSTDFVLDVAWDAGLLALNLDDCELAASPQDRTHPDPISYWGTTEGYGLAFINCDGVRAQFATKGGSGIFIDSASVIISGSNEGAGTGNTDRDTPGTTGMRIRQPRSLILGAYLKSTAKALVWDMENHGDTATVVGAQLTDGGDASFELIRGRAVMLGVTTRGLGRFLLSDPTTVAMSSLDILHGDVTPSQLIGTTENKARASLRWRTPNDHRILNQIAHTWAWWTWDASGNPVQTMTVSSAGVSFAPQALTVSSGALNLTNAHHGAHLVLDGVGNGIALDANTVYDGFTIRIVNLRGSDWAWPAFTNGTVQVVGFYVSAPTKVRNNGELTLTVRVVGGSRKILLRGDLTT